LASEEKFTSLKVKASLQPEKPIPDVLKTHVQEPSSVKADSSVSPALHPKTENQYAIHVGSFKVKENAFELRDRLQKKDYPVLCTRVPIPGKGEWYRVEVGYYSNPEEAQQVLSKLESEEKIAPVRLVEH
jgi:cell division septation protein DedD